MKAIRIVLLNIFIHIKRQYNSMSFKKEYSKPLDLF